MMTYKDNPVTTSEKAREAFKKSPYYFDLNKLKNEKFYMIVQKAYGYGKTHAVIKERNDGE